MKYIVLLCDGMSDEPQAELGGKTLIEYANTPNMDALAKGGRLGLVHSTPNGMAPGSDICNLAIFGYDPRKYYTGRSPLEAVSMGIELGSNDMAFRCNMVTLADNYSLMEDFSAHHIDNDSAGRAIERLKKMFTGSGIEFYQGLSYRHLMVVRNRALELETTPPHDISGRKVAEYLPKGRDAALINEIMQDSRDAFHQDTGEATSIWLWGQGKRPAMPTYKELYGLNGAAIAAVDLIKGIAGCAGMDIIDVPGATGFIDTNFEGKARYGIEALRDHDYVFIHVEAPDEAGHMGRLDYKLSAIESIDSKMLPILMEGAKALGDCRILLTPDHPTPIRVKTHMAAPVPAIIWGTGVEPDSNMTYTENMQPSFDLKEGYKIAAELFK